MIAGVMTADHEAIIPLTVRGPAGRECDIEAVIDTGSSGWLSLPPPVIAFLGLPWRRRGRALLADGSDSIFDVHDGAVVWDGQPLRIPVDSAQTAPLVGMSMLSGYELSIQVRVNGQVALQALP